MRFTREVLWSEERRAWMQRVQATCYKFGSMASIHTNTTRQMTTKKQQHNNWLRKKRKKKKRNVRPTSRVCPPLCVLVVVFLSLESSVPPEQNCPFILPSSFHTCYLLIFFFFLRITDNNFFLGFFFRISHRSASFSSCSSTSTCIRNKP